MSEARIEALGEGHFKVTGPLSFETARPLLIQSTAEFGAWPRLDIDLSGVSQSDSAGLALLVEWMRQARARQQKIHFQSIPSQLLALAQISDLDELLLANGEAH